MLVSAFAKLNLSLEVLGRRSDGFHEIRSVMQAVDLADRIEIRPAPELTVSCDCPDLEGERNLVWRAARDLAACGGKAPAAEITVSKRIPVGMGLGGGSSDAAAVLLALNEFWELKLPLASLAEIAAGLGSDVPYFLWGGAALSTGRGELVEPLPSRPGVGVTLVCPQSTLENKTARLYSRLTPGHYSDGGVTRLLLQNIMTGQYADELFSNVFEVVALSEFPSLREIYHLVAASAGRRPHLTGAGPALFLMPSNEEECRRVSGALPPSLARAYFVRTLGRAGQRTPFPFSEN